MADAPPVLTPVASASEQFSGKGTQELMVQNPKDMEGCFHIDKPLFSKELGSHARA